MTIISNLPGGNRIETALVTVGRLLRRFAAPVPNPPARRERRYMNG